MRFLRTILLLALVIGWQSLAKDAKPEAVPRDSKKEIEALGGQVFLERSLK